MGQEVSFHKTALLNGVSLLWIVAASDSVEKQIAP